MKDHDTLLAKITQEREAEREWQRNHRTDPVFSQEINWTLIQYLGGKPHPTINADFLDRVDETRDENGHVHLPGYVVGEMTQEHIAVHHLLDMIGVPCPLPSVGGAGHPADLDARVFRAISGVMTLQERLGRIAEWHSRETGPAGTVGDYCNECGQTWPCDTKRMAEGTYTNDPDDMSVAVVEAEQ